MKKPSKNVKIESQIYEDVAEIAAMNSFSISMMANILLRQGLESALESGVKLHQKPANEAEIDVRNIINSGAAAAEKGSELLHEFLASLTGGEEYSVKYCIKGWREIAARVDRENEDSSLPDIIKKGDKFSLWGREHFVPFWNKLTKTQQANLKHSHYKKWWFDSGRADSDMRIHGRALGRSTYANYEKNQAEFDENEKDFLTKISQSADPVRG